MVLQCVATDASSLGMGVVAAPIAADTAVAVAALPPLHNASSLAPTSWRTIISYPWRHPEHINVLELRALSTCVRWVISHPSSNCRRLLLLSDSQVAVGALSKGRSSSFQILRRLRFISAMVLATGLQLYARWIDSASNPADGPSRGFTAH